MQPSRHDELESAPPIEIRFWDFPKQAQFCRRVLGLATVNFTPQQQVARRLVLHLHESFELFRVSGGDGLSDEILDWGESICDASEPLFRHALSRSASTPTSSVAPPVTRRIR